MEERSEKLEALGEPAIPGVQLASIQGYIDGKVEPSVRFLEEAAHVLGVRPAWLTYGDGEPTTAHEVERVLATREGAERFFPREVTARAHLIRWAIAKGAHQDETRTDWTFPLHQGSAPLVALADLWRRRWLARGGDSVSEEVELELARQLGRAVVAPIEALGIEWRDSTTMYFFLHEHITAMAPVLFQALAYDDPPVLDVAATIRDTEPDSQREE